MGFPEQLKAARLHMNYTQQQIAELMGITKSTYCGYETGKREPDVLKIKLLADILQTSGDVLLETGFGPNYLPQSKAEEQLIALHRELNQEGQEKLLDYADDLIASGEYIKSDPNKLDKAKNA